MKPNRKHPRPGRFSGRGKAHARLPRLEELETRRLLATDVLSYRYNVASSGVDATETALTPTTVNQQDFGKVAQSQVDGQIYAEPLVKTGVNITTGLYQGVHDVVFAATEHDSVYAFDANSGKLLWQRSLFDTGIPGATSVTTVPSTDVASGDITVEIGITGTPVIDPANNTMYVVAATKQMVGTTAHYVQFLFALNISNGANAISPHMIGDTTDAPGDTNGTNINQNNTQIYVYGTGSGYVKDPYNNTGKNVDQFNALRESQRGR